MRQQDDSGALDDKMNVAPPPHECLELAQQVALDVESTWAWSAWHTLSIDAALCLFPKPGSNFRLFVLVSRGAEAQAGGEGVAEGHDLLGDIQDHDVGDQGRLAVGACGGKPTRNLGADVVVDVA